MGGESCWLEPVLPGHTVLDLKRSHANLKSTL